MRNGTTLVELALVMVITTLLAALSLPALARLRDSLAVSDAAAAVTGAHARARLLATVEQRIMILSLSPDSLVIRAVEAPGDTTERWRAGGPAESRVTSRGFPRQISFAPSGVAFGVANGTYEFTRGASTRTVIVSRYGRVRQN